MGNSAFAGLVVHALDHVLLYTKFYSIDNARTTDLVLEKAFTDTFEEKVTDTARD